MWEELIKEEIEKPYYKKMNEYLTKEYKQKECFPKEKYVFAAFKYTPFEKVKVVVIGQDPYHNEGQAMGLAFSVNRGMKIPPSLLNIYKELRNDLGYEIPNHGDLRKWADEGVLLLNTILTVEAHTPLSHKGIGWERFTNRMITSLDEDNRPKVFVLWGNNAIKKKELLKNSNHLIITSSHPSPLSARHSFFGSRVFSRINDYLLRNNIEPINFNVNEG